MAVTMSLKDEVQQGAQLVNGLYQFEGKTPDQWMQAMIDAETAGEPERVCNRAYRISGLLDCLNDFSEE